MSIYNAPLLQGLPGTQVVGWGSHDPYTTKVGGPRSDPPGLVAELERLVGRRELRYGLKLPVGDEAELAYLERQLRHALSAIYEAIDHELGLLLAELRPDDVVLVVSPHGMGPNPHLEEIGDGVLAAAGLLRRADQDAAPPTADRRVRALAGARRVVHRLVPAGLRPALGRLVPRERLVGALEFADVDWSATRAFQVWGDGATLVRINLQGREPAGIVTPAAYEALRDDVMALFDELVDADTGQPAVIRTARYEDVGGGPPTGEMPDVCVQWRRDSAPGRAIAARRRGRRSGRGGARVDPLDQRHAARRRPRHPRHRRGTGRRAADPPRRLRRDGARAVRRQRRRPRDGAAVWPRSTAELPEARR